MDKKFDRTWNFEAGTVEEAIALALKKMGCLREDIDVTVVSEEKKGLFGMNGAEPAKIVVKRK